MNQRRIPLFEILDARGVSRRWFAHQVGIHETTLSKIDNGKRPIPTWLKAAAAKVLQLPESVLFLPSNVREGTKEDRTGKAP